MATPSLSNRADKYVLVSCLVLGLVFLMAASPSTGQQQAHQWTERENYGFKGPVRSVRTTIARPNPDPRPKTLRKLFLEVSPDRAVFDIEGRRIEYGATSTPDGNGAISKCTFGIDGSKTCIDSAGHQQESSERRTILPDGSREVTHFLDSKALIREVTSFDEKGTAIAFSDCRSDGSLSSEDLTLPNGDEEYKLYDDNGRVIDHFLTRVSDDRKRIDRWSYDSEGQLVWSLALNSDGDLLSYWYDIGFKPKVNSSDSLGVHRAGLTVDYKFDDEGSGRPEKTVQHTQGDSNIEPDSEEHYNLDGILDERAEIKYARDGHGNWTSRSVFVWDANSNLMIEIERDTRTIEYY